MDVLEKYEVRQIFDAGYPKPQKTPTGKDSTFGLFVQAGRNGLLANHAAPWLSQPQARSFTSGDN